MICTRSIRPFAALIAMIVALAVMASAADARIGGGFSSGTRGGRTFSAPPPTSTAPGTAKPFERTLTQPGAPAAPGARPGGFFNRPGLLGGLAAGFLGAGLLGLLFGGGLFGGLGGFASLLGLVLQIALVVVVARLIWAWWQRRNTPSYAGASMLRGLSPDHRGSDAGPVGSGIAGGAVAIGPSDYDTFERLLGELQSAYAAEDLNALRTHATPEMVSYFADDLAKNSSRGVVNRVSDVKLLQGDLSEAWREGEVEYATVALRYALKDYYVERASGRVVEGDPNRLTEATELWTFMRRRGGSWLLSAIQQT